MTATHDPITIARFWSKVNVRGANECWLWTGTIQPPKGYGRFQRQRAHRFAYEVTTGEIPPEMVVRHRCHNKLCCNPRHLAVGTPADNSLDDLIAGQTMRGERHGRSKLSTEQVAYIRTSGKRGKDLAAELGVAESTISEIRSCKWRANG